MNEQQKLYSIKCIAENKEEMLAAFCSKITSSAKLRSGRQYYCNVAKNMDSIQPMVEVGSICAMPLGEIWKLNHGQTRQVSPEWC